MPPDKKESDPFTSSASAVTEPLACVTCRARKLKCDRTTPACSRCIKISSECVYPESRRKPTVKRKNVKELEARLAQVEDYLKEVNKALDEDKEQDSNSSKATQRNDQSVDPVDKGLPDVPPIPFVIPDVDSLPDVTNSPFGNTQMMGLGITEALPPDNVMEELNGAFFQNQYPVIPIVHPGRYMQAFYGGPMKKPPMCLQYTIWALAAVGHARYHQYHEIFYRRARQYVEADEMSGQGERFISISHAQSWALIAFYEAKVMLFTRSTMSVAKSVRLCQMLGLDRIDGEPLGLPPSLPQALTWAELEERRRVFWGVFSIDAHAVIATGWPTLINMEDIALRLPASEDAFMSDRKEEAPFIHQVSEGSDYSGFAGTVIICHIFRNILRHVHRSKPNDKAEDVTNGPFWARHRELDNLLSSIFMFLPERLRLPQNLRDSSAASMNLNLHASVICLHHAAVEKCDKHGLPECVKEQSLARLRTTAEEVVNIIRLASHTSSIFKSPLCALALYLTTTVYVYMAKQNPTVGLSTVDLSNLGVIITAMEAVSRTHKITRAFLQQASLDIERNGLGVHVHVPALKKYRTAFSQQKSTVPVLARSSVTKHSGTEPLISSYQHFQPSPSMKQTASTPSQPKYDFRKGEEGNISRECFSAILGAVSRNVAVPDNVDPTTHKRKRTSGSPEPERMGVINKTTSLWGKPSVDSTDNSRTTGAPWSSMKGHYGNSFVMANMSLPDRTNSSVASSPANQGSGLRTVSDSSHTSPDVGVGMGLGNTAEENRVDLRAFQDRISTPIWQSIDETFFEQFVETMVTNALPSDGSDPWGILNSDINWEGDGLRNEGSSGKTCHLTTIDNEDGRG